MYLRISALLLICLWGYSTAQDEISFPPYLEDTQTVMLDTVPKLNKSLPKKTSNETWWSKNKNIVRTIFFVAAAGSAGVAIWQNAEASKEKDNAAIWYDNTAYSVTDKNKNKYELYSRGYEKSVDNIQFHESVRNGFYISAGLFGVAGILSVCF